MGRIIAKRIRGMNWMAKVSLVLIFTLVFSTFMYQGWYKPKVSEAAPTADGRIFYSINTTTPQNRTYTASSNTFGAQTATLTGANPTFMVNKSAPTRNENMAGYVSGTTLYIYKWDGATWIEVTNTVAPGGWGVGTRPTVGGNGVNGRRFDIAYENTSGDAMVVYSKNVNGNAGVEMAYRKWNGTSWTAATDLPNSARLAQAATVTSIKLASRRGSNEIAVFAADSGTTTLNTATFTAFIWNGSAWGNEPGTTFGTTYNTTGQLFQNDLFDLAYESLSGDLFCVFTTATPQQNYRTYSGGTWSAVASYATGRAAPLQMLAESNPNSDQILMMFNRSASASVYANVWTGTAVGTTTTVGADGVTTAVNKKHITGKWLNVGGTDYAVAMWVTTTAGTIGYNYFSGAAWGTAGTYATGVASAIQWMDTDADPFGSDTLMLTYSNALNDLYAKRLVLSAGPTFTWTNADGGAALTAALTNITTQNFDFEYSRLDTTPPVTSGLTFDSPVYSTYVGSPFTFHGDLTDDGSSVTSCQICVKNGSECISTDTWIAGTLTGSSPTWTCTATNVTTYSNGGAIATGNNVYIDVRGTSAGGTNTDGGTAIFLTMDKTVPTDGGAPTVTSGGDTASAAITISWNAASDAQSGFKTYDVRYQSGGTAPSCSTGTSVYTGTSTSYAHVNLTNNQQYSYRVCAYDNVNNISTGVIGSATAKWSSTTTSCGRCHAYSPADGTQRNTPAGAVVGSHSLHKDVCSTCHITPATETSVDYKHRDANIKMKTGATGIGSGFYDKDNSGAFNSPADETWAQTNTVTTQSCRNISCHGGNNPTAVWGVGTVGCMSCHSSAVDGGDGAPTRRGMSTEITTFTWSHKRTPGAWTNNDCGVCHMEGNPNTGQTTSYHKNNLLEFRDPDTGSEIQGVSFSGTPGSYTSTGSVVPNADKAAFSRNTNSNTIEPLAAAVMINMCLKCHDSDASAGAGNGGAKSSAAWVPSGSALRPFNTAPTHTPGNNVLDVNAHFNTANASYHPIRGKQNNSYADIDSMNVPWEYPAKTGGQTDQWGYLMTCWDCHDSSSANRTIGGANASVIHGNAQTLRAAYTLTAGSSTAICVICHKTSVYWTTYTHNTDLTGVSALDNVTDTAWTSRHDIGEGNYFGCGVCHGTNSSATKPARPLPAENTHGFNTLASGATTWTSGASAWGFLRNNTNMGDWDNSPGSCNMNGTGNCEGYPSYTYSPGGTY